MISEELKGFFFDRVLMNLVVNNDEVNKPTNTLDFKVQTF